MTSKIFQKLTRAQRRAYFIRYLRSYRGRHAAKRG